MSTIKQVVDSLVAAGTPLSDIIRQVNVAAVDKALVMNYGNQTRAAQQLRCHRHVVRKYTLVRQEKQMVGRWRDNTGERPTRRSHRRHHPRKGRAMSRRARTRRDKRQPIPDFDDTEARPNE